MVRARFRGAAVAVMVFGGLVASASDVAYTQSARGVEAEPAVAGGATTMRRLNEAQYKRAIGDIFGPAIKVPGRFEPPLRERGLLAIGEGRVAVSASGLEQYELRAREIAAQVMAPESRKQFISCNLPSAATVDAACAEEFLKKIGLRLYRRPLTQGELDSALRIVRSGTEVSGDFYQGMEHGLARLLGSPNFIFRVERSEVDAGTPGGWRLDDYSLASRISFLLWDAPPDEALLAAVAAGSLRSDEGLARQVDRLIASPRFKDGVRAFFSDMFAFEQFKGLSKDQAIYPKFNSQLANDAQEQLLRTIVDLLVVKRGDYRQLFTTRTTFMNRNLAALYRVPLREDALEDWSTYTFAPSNPRAGILTLAGFLMLDPTHEGRSSPTIRGKTVREQFLCQEVPLPPANVDFAEFEDSAGKVKKTARDRLSVHQENPVCAGCHAITDPIGLAMENYDAIGQFRTHENGALIDTAGEFEGKQYSGAIQLQRLLHDNPSAATCVVQRAYEYGVGRSPTPDEERWVNYAQTRFAHDKYQLPRMLRRLATSKAFRSTSAPKMALVNAEESNR